MVSNCANPTCSAVFRKFSEGTVFHVPVAMAAPENSTASGVPTLERFWLCEECSSRMVVVPDPSGAGAMLLRERPAADSGGAAKQWLR